jgi:hypothetical protein
MAIIKKEDIEAYSIGELILCHKCFSEQEEDADQYYTEHDLENMESIVVCDKCDKTIWR